MTRQTEIRYDDDLGGMTYPFLPPELQWEIVSRPLGNAGQMQAIYDAPLPTLRWVKDDKVPDLHVPGMDTEAFLARSGLSLAMARARSRSSSPKMATRATSPGSRCPNRKRRATACASTTR